MDEMTFEQLKLCYETIDTILEKRVTEAGLEYVIRKDGKETIVSEERLLLSAKQMGWLSK